jgi:polysaccharide biosynthesis protein PslH
MTAPYSERPERGERRPDRPLRILLLAPFPPRRDGAHGGARALSGLTRALAAEHRVALLYLRAADEPPTDHDLLRVCDQVVEVVRDEPRGRGTRRLGQQLRNVLGLLRGRPIWVSKWASAALPAQAGRILREWEPDILQLEFEVMGRFLDDLGRFPCPVVLTVHDPGHASARETASAARGSLFAHLDARAWLRFERATLERVDGTVAFTDRDVGELRAAHPSADLTRIPLGYPVPETPASPTGRGSSTILFVGNFVHPPNLDAARWLVDAILPDVRAAVPGARLVLVGDGPPAVDPATHGVTATGRVADVWPYLEEAAVVAVPIRTGGGMRVKLLEALAAGKAVVATPRAAEGLDVTHGEQLLLADSARGFAQALVLLLTDVETRARIAGSARAWAEQHLAWARTAAEYERLYRRLLRARQPAKAPP